MSVSEMLFYWVSMAPPKRLKRILQPNSTTNQKVASSRPFPADQTPVLVTSSTSRSSHMQAECCSHLQRVALQSHLSKRLQHHKTTTFEWYMHKARWAFTPAFVPSLSFKCHTFDKKVRESVKTMSAHLNRHRAAMSSLPVPWKVFTYLVHVDLTHPGP